MSDNWAYSLRDVGQMLGLHRNTVGLLVKKGELPSVKVGGSRRILDEDLTAYLNRRRNVPSVFEGQDPDAEEATVDPVASLNEVSLVSGRTSSRSAPTLP